MVSGMPEGAYRLVDLVEQCRVFKSFGMMVMCLMENNNSWFI